MARRRKYAQGAREGDRLASWLNSARGADQSFIEDLIERLQSLLNDADKARAEDRLGTGNPERQELEEFREEINEGCLRQFHPDIIVTAPHDDGTIGFGFTPPQDTGRVSLQRYGAFLEVFELARRGYIRQMVRCEECDGWLFSRAPYGERQQRVHAGKCKQTWMRAKMAAYMRHKRNDPTFDGAGFFAAPLEAASLEPIKQPKPKKRKGGAK